MLLCILYFSPCYSTWPVFGLSQSLLAQNPETKYYKFPLVHFSSGYEWLQQVGKAMLGRRVAFNRKRRHSSQLPRVWTALSKMAATVHHDKAVWFSGVWPVSVKRNNRTWSFSFKILPKQLTNTYFDVIKNYGEIKLCHTRYSILLGHLFKNRPCHLWNSFHSSGEE